MGIGQTILDILSYLFWLRSRGVNEPESERIGVDVVIHTTHKWALKLGSRFIASCALLAFFLCCVFTHSVYFSLFVSLDCFDSRILNPVDGRTFDDPSQSASQPASEPKLVVVVHWSYNIRGSSSSLSSIQVKQRELGTQNRTKCLLLVVVCRSVSVAVGMWIPALFVCQCNRFKRFCMYRCVRCSSVLFLFQHCWVSQIAVPQNLFRFSSVEDNFCRQTPTHSKHSFDASVFVAD